MPSKLDQRIPMLRPFALREGQDSTCLGKATRNTASIDQRPLDGATLR